MPELFTYLIEEKKVLFFWIFQERVSIGLLQSQIDQGYNLQFWYQIVNRFSWGCEKFFIYISSPLSRLHVPQIYLLTHPRPVSPFCVFHPLLRID